MVLAAKKPVRSTKRALQDYLLAAEGLVLLLAMALAIRFLPFARLKAIASFPLRERRWDRDAENHMVRRVKWAIAASARRSPLRAKCFEQGLTAQLMLRRRGIDSALFYGLARGGVGQLHAHVWVKAGQVPICGTDNADDFAMLLQLPPESDQPLSARPDFD